MANFNRLLHRWEVPVLIALSIRIMLYVFSFWLNSNIHFLDDWIRWDGPHYIDIAQLGYQTTGEKSLFIVFYPLYPALVKIFTLITGSYVVSALSISFIFSIIASVVLYELVLLDYGRREAILAIWFMNIFPTSYFLQASYTESLFITLSVLTVYFYRKKRFLLSGLTGLLSTATRFNGLMLLPLLLIDAKLQKKSFITFLLLPLGFLFYLLLNFILFQNPFYFTIALETNWYKKIDWPWHGMRNLINSVPNFSDPGFYIYFSEIIALIFLVLVTIFVLIKSRKSYFVYLVTNLLLFTSTSFILSTPRYLLGLFPIFIAFGLIKNKIIIFLVSLISVTMLIYFTYIYTQGKWAY